MMDSPDTRVLAIDGGGTRCRVALFDGRDAVMVETGSANVATDFDGGIREILEGIDALARRTGETRRTLADLPAFVGLAGVTGPAIADRILSALPFTRIRVEDDRPAALRGALGDRDGVVGHCGTGSFFGAQIGGEMRFSGGWGPVIGDEASAQWIGRKALGATLEAVDGRTEMSGLAETFLARFDGAAGVVRFAASASPSVFGALAPEVTEAAGDGDEMALRIMRSGAAEIVHGLQSIGWVSGLAICLTGGVGPCYGAYLPPEMQAELVEPERQPLAGAIALAQDFAKEQTR